MRRVLASRDHFEALSALPGETELARGPHFDGAEASKRWKRLSKALHPDKNRARDADEAQKRVNLANDVLKDAAARHKYELTLPPDARRRRGAGPSRPAAPQAPPQYSRDYAANRAREEAAAPRRARTAAANERARREAAERGESERWAPRRSAPRDRRECRAAAPVGAEMERAAERSFMPRRSRG